MNVPTTEQVEQLCLESYSKGWCAAYECLPLRQWTDVALSKLARVPESFWEEVEEFYVSVLNPDLSPTLFLTTKDGKKWQFRGLGLELED